MAAARLGGNVSFISKIGADAFGQMAQRMYAAEKVDTRFIVSSSEHATGAAAIIVDDATGENAIIVTPGAGNALTKAEIDAAREQIRNSAVFMTQLELPLETVEHGLRLARELGVPTILNPAPACKLSDSLLQLCDFLTPNETEAEELTGQSIVSLADAEKAADILLGRGVSTVILTLGARGAFVKNSQVSQHLPAFQAGPVIDTTRRRRCLQRRRFGSRLLRKRKSIHEAVRFACTVAGISVTRPGTAPSMPTRAEPRDASKV